MCPRLPDPLLPDDYQTFKVLTQGAHNLVEWEETK